MSNRLIHPALLQLIRLNTRARVRRLSRGLRKPKGIVLACLALGAFGMWIVPTIVMSFLRPRTDPAIIRSLASMGLLAFCLINLLSLKPGSGIAFRPAEVDFLFPGPFRRREVLAYKILGIVLTALGGALIPALFLMPHVHYFLAGFVGVALAFLFIQLLHVGAALLAANVAMRAFTRARKLLLIGAAAAIGLSIHFAVKSSQGLTASEVFTRFRESRIGGWVIAPFDVFGRIITAQSIVPELTGWAAVGLAMSGGLVVLLLWLDADYLEASIETSRKLHDRMQRMRQGQHPLTASARLRLKWRVPRLPWLGGIGPNAWRQLVIAVRSMGALAVMGLIMATTFVVPMLVMRRGTGGTIASASLMPLLMMSLFMLPQFIRFDFRGDIERIDALKSLPVTATAMVLGQISIPVLFASLIQFGIVVAAAWLQGSVSFYFAVAACFTLPLNLLVFGLENLMFLWYPYRQTPGSVDITAMGSQMLLVFLRIIVLFVAAGVAALVGGAVYWITGSQIAFAVISWFSLTGFGIALIPVVASAYTRFDPSLDTPG